jgi:hypothetical protein
MSSSNWWSQKLGATPPSTSLPPSQPQTRPEAFVQGNQEVYNASTPPVVAQPAETGPGCRSGNYTKVGSMATANGTVHSYQCYDCGYPVVQQGSGLGGVAASSNGPARASRQVEGGGWNPGTIIDRIS